MIFAPQKKKVYIFLGQEDKETLCGELADAYEKGARDAGHDVRRANIGDLHFDPLLHKGYKEIQALEPDLKKVQEDIRWAEHIVIFHPMWWSLMPAILKGFFDRVWLPGFAYHFHPHLGWSKLLKGRTAQVFITMDSWPLISGLLFGDQTNEISRAILGFAGIRSKVKKIGLIKHCTPHKREALKKKMMHHGRNAR